METGFKKSFENLSRCPKHQTVNGFAATSRESRQERGYGSNWENLRKIVLRRDKGLCLVCRKAAAKAVDHIVNKARGGTDALNNLQAICNRCHGVKTAKEGGRAV